MNVHLSTWIITIVVLGGALIVDAVVIGRRPHVPTTRECTRYIVFYAGLALLFGAGIWYFSGGTYAQQFYTGWLTEYSLSLDNLFIFLLIMEKQRVPRHVQQFALMVGIMLSLVLRGLFIGIGAVMINRLAWVFFLFGAYLLYTAWNVLKDFRAGSGTADELKESVILRWAKAHVPTTGTWEGDRVVVHQGGSRKFTLLFFTIVTLGTTDLLFALDSIPAIFGLTSEPYIVFAANVFALMGLRQLFFLLGDLLDRLYYLPVGLFVLLGFIGLKLVAHAMHHYGYDARLGALGTVLGLALIAVAALAAWALVRVIARVFGDRWRTWAWLGCGAAAVAGAGVALAWLVRRMDAVSAGVKVPFNGNISDREEVSTLVSLGVIVLTLAITAIVSVARSRRRAAAVTA